jgi:hypothetical protein
MLFDFLQSEYPLPFPSPLSGDKEFRLSKVHFHTQSFSVPAMDEYEIAEDGQLYRWAIDKEVTQTEIGLQVKENSRELSRQDFSGEVFFFGVYLGKKHDYYIEYKALFWKGDLKEVHLEKCDEEDNTRRKASQKKIKAAVDEYLQKKDKWWYNIYSWCTAVVRFFTDATRWFLELFIRLTWKVEKWLT